MVVGGVKDRTRGGAGGRGYIIMDYNDGGCVVCGGCVDDGRMDDGRMTDDGRMMDG